MLTLTPKVYKANSDIYEKLVTLSERYKEPVMETGNIRSEIENEHSSISEMGNDIQNEVVNCADRRQRS